MNQFEMIIKSILLVLLYVALSVAYANEESLTSPEEKILGSEVFTPYIATYQVLRNDKDIGRAKRVLEKVNANEFRLTINSEASLFFYSFENSEESIFTKVNEQIAVQKYSYWDKRTFKSKNTIKQLFDWQTMLETGTKNQKNWQRTFKEGSYDTLNYILRLRQDLSQGKTDTYVYQVNDEGKEETYTLRYEGLTEVGTQALGKLPCHQVTRFRATSTRLTTFCFAPSLDYAPIMVRQSKDGEEQAKMLIDSISFQ